MTDQPSRREFVRVTAALGAVGATGALAGCTGGSGDEPRPADETATDGGTGGDDGGTGTTETGGGTGGDSTPTGEGGSTTVAAGPDGELVFEPEEVTVAAGETVTWEFVSAGHNVSAYPDHADPISIPDDAEPFGSPGVEEDKYATVEAGETYEHTFETAGEYTYACIPHVGSGMIGTVVVEE